MCPFERPTLERCLQVSCVALAPSVMLASVQLLVRTQGKNQTPDFLSHDTDRWALHLLLRGRPERRADASLAARAALFIADVRAPLRQAVRSLSPCRARQASDTATGRTQKNSRIPSITPPRSSITSPRRSGSPVHALHARL